MSGEIKSIIINDGDEYIFDKLEDLVYLLKQDGYEVRLKIKKKHFRTTEVIL